jgi:hypothetical protein
MKEVSPVLCRIETCPKQQRYISCIINFKNQAEKCAEFHTYKFEDERSYKPVLKICTTPSTLRKSKF